ncbi:hypothetical protein [Streptomyces sp. NPDC006285]|uniref:hypothetical protein n=1 Tax=Streptomyces sp. NPDC006285 TaxID=3364742 RepID=UPI0036CF5FB7
MGEAGQSVDASEADGCRRVAELGDGGGEAFGVQASGVAQSAILVDALATVGHDQGDQGACADHDPEGKLDQIEQSCRVDAAFGLQLACPEQVPTGVKDRGRDQDRSGEGQGQSKSDGPQTQTASFGPATA